MDYSKKISYSQDLIRKNKTKVSIFMSSKTLVDPYEKNYTFADLNPKTIKAYVTEISPEALVWKSYGLKEMGAKEIICEDRYAEWFKLCNKVEIDGDQYEVFKEGNANRAIIQK